MQTQTKFEQTKFDPTLPAWALAQPKPMRSAIHTITALLTYSPAVEMAALYRPGAGKGGGEGLQIFGRITTATVPDEILRMLAVARGKNTCRGANILIRPDPAQPHPWHPWLLLDDIPTPKALALAKEHAALVVETSANNCQVRILSTRPLSSQERHEAQAALQKMHHGDPGSTAGDKWSRLPGFTNRKPQKSGQWTNLLADTTRSSPRTDPALLFSPPPPAGAVCTPAPSRARVGMGGGGGGGATKTKADYARAALAMQLPRASEGLCGWRMEIAHCCQAVRAGLDDPEIIEALALRAHARGKRATIEQARVYAKGMLIQARRMVQA